uniref:Uncharacterized protein n=2 Tax=Rhizophagus irregularis TaxID=588596 RepID=U9UFF9_RHIID
MQIAISIRNLRKIIIHRLEAKYDLPLPCNINIPSIEWIRLQFWPTNPTSTRAMHYNGQFNIKYQIQARQLPDDMHKVPIREGVATSTGVRNKKSLVSTNTTLTASDYDFTKLSLTPSVIFFIDVPTTIEDSFYHGNVFVSYKDTGVAIMSTELEDIFKKVDTLEEIHAAATKNEDLKNGLHDSNTDCYEGFKTVYNTEISEKYHPILMAAMENAERAPPAILTNTKVHDIIQCFQCGKF